MKHKIKHKLAPRKKLAPKIAQRVTAAALILALLYFLWPIFSWLVVDAVFWPVTAEACLNSAGEAIRGACWPAVMDTFKLLLVGRYPAEEQWRVLAALAVLIVGAVALTTRFSGRRKISRQIKALVTVTSLIVSAVLISGWSLIGIVPVETALWGGFLLTAILSIIGVAAGSTLGLALALGRSSTMLVPRLLTTAYIETVRGVPLITVLFFAMYVFPLFLPSGWSNISEFGRAAVAIVLFEAAYFAEVIRAGLGAVPQGQHEAAKALGLNAAQRLRLVIFPQAFKISLPALIATTIGLVKDTSLIAVIGMFDLLGAARNVPSIPKWIGRDLEPLIFAALFYLVLSLALDSLAKKFELQRSPAV
jgi:general L-amino acid transport system permease protein